MWYFPKWLTLLTNFYFLVQSWVLLYSEWTINKVIDTWYTVPVPFPYWQEKEKKKCLARKKKLADFFFGGYFFKSCTRGGQGRENETDRHQCKVTGLIPHLELIQRLLIVFLPMSLELSCSEYRILISRKRDYMSKQ